MEQISNYNLLHNNTFGISAKCETFIEFISSEEAEQKLPLILKNQKPLMILGGGSNLLLTKDFPGTIVHSAIKGISVKPLDDGDVLLTAGSGEVWDDVVATAISLGYYGMENLSIIPGEVGASAVQNIGAYGREIKDIIEEIHAVEICSGRSVTILASECNYSYRQSIFKKEWKNRYFITSVTYRLHSVFTPYLEYGGILSSLQEKHIEHPTAQDVRDIIINIRNAKLPDPAIEGNAGSFFMNPVVSREKFLSLQKEYPQMPHYNVDSEHEKIPVGWMIDLCGWKGKQMGNAGVHSKQALVLVNKGNATGNEIVALCEAIRKDVKEKFGIDIHPEVNIY